MLQDWQKWLSILWYNITASQTLLSVIKEQFLQLNSGSRFITSSALRDNFLPYSIVKKWADGMA